MNATLVLPGTAPEADWLDARRRGVTASDIAVLMGLSDWSSPYALYHRKRGDLPAEDGNLAMAIGRHFEDFVADLFAEQHPEFGVAGDGRSLYAHPDAPWQMATPDRLLLDGPACKDCGQPDCPWHALPVAVLECKTDNGLDGWGDDGTDEIPVKYRAQVLWQCDVLGVGHWYLACLFTTRRQLRVYEGDIDQAARADLELMRAEAQEFLGRIERGDPPDVDWRPATTAALRALHPSVQDVDVPVSRMPIIRYRAACKAYKAAEQRKRAAENTLRELLGDGHRIVSAHTGEVIARRDAYDVKAHARKASHVDKLVPVNKKEAPK